MADRDSGAILSVNITRGLTDKLVERRKAAALELEKTVKEMVVATESSMIKQVIFALEHDFTLSSNPNSRKGGLVGLAATSIALGRGPEGTLLALVRQFERWLVRFEALWSVLDEVDRECWVLEPEKPTRACTYRRIVIGDNLSLHMVLEPLSPTSRPQLTFLGADKDILPLISMWNSSLHKWRQNVSLLENLRSILSISLPSAPSATDQEEGEECAICYAYRWDGHAPSVVCGNSPCSRVFHNQCLYEWLRSLQTVTKYFNKITGECPNCGHSISSTASS